MMGEMGHVLEFRVSKKQQASSGGSYIVKFDAAIELMPGEPVSVEIGSLHEHSEDCYKEEAEKAILAGFRSVLEPRNLGGRCLIENLLLHSVDFSPRNFTECSAEALSAHLVAIDAD
jgi:hypothetical protein